MTFGGATSGKKNNSKISELDMGKGEWESFGNDVDMPYIHNDRWGHSATFVPHLKKVFLIGGWDSTSQYMDTYTFDVNKKELKRFETSGETPICRALHSAVYWGNEIIIFGGTICKGGPYLYYDDVFRLDVDTGVWNEIKCFSLSQPPGPTAQHSAHIIWNRFMIVIGGCDSKWRKNDVYCLDLKLSQWHKVQMSGDIPAPINYNSQDFRVIPSRHSCFQLDLDTLLVYGICNGVYFIDLKLWKWIKIPEKNGILPRVAHIGCQSANNIILMGGCEFQNNQETRSDRSVILTFVPK